MTFAAFYSDPHFDHKNIIGFAGRPFVNVADMERGLIERYNAVVSSTDTVLWLGDCFWKTSKYRAADILSRMNGQKVLVAGNHDKSPGWMAEVGFLGVTDELVISIAGHPVRCSHFPYAPSNPSKEHPSDARFLHLHPKRRKGEALLHGHTHKPNKVVGTAIHVGVDAWGCGPAPLAEVEKLVKKIFND